MKRVLFLLAAVWLWPVQAQVLDMPAPGDTDAPSIDRSMLPRRGLSMDGVRAAYGEPVSSSPAIGDPPITRWVYDDFVVFFEYQHVINAVIPNKPAPIYHQDELRARER